MLKLVSLFSPLLIGSMNSPAPGMQSIIDRYNRQKEAQSHQQFNHASYIKFLQKDTAKLKKELQALHDYHRQLMGEELSGLGVRDLQNLENQLEIRLKGIRKKKENLFYEENIQLHKQLDELHKERSDLGKKQVNEEKDIKTDNGLVKNATNLGIEQQNMINLQMTQPEEPLNLRLQLQ
ncbi:Agamous-like MADS-box protein AGL21 [Linum perenne]